MVETLLATALPQGKSPANDTFQEAPLSEVFYEDLEAGSEVSTDVETPAGSLPSVNTPQSLLSSNSTVSAPLDYLFGVGELSAISIAQGGLRRIRRDARSAEVKLVDVVKIFGRTLEAIAQSADIEVQRRGIQELNRHASAFKAPSYVPGSLPDFVWKIVLSLNKPADPCLFAIDGSDLARKNKSSAVALEPNQGLKTDDNSAMGRGLRCLLLALVYIDRIIEKHPKLIILTKVTIHRLLLTAIYMAAKYSDDSLPQLHKWFSRLGGVSFLKMKKMELAFCSLIEFEFYVSEVEFQSHCMEQLRWAVRGARTYIKIHGRKKSHAQKEEEVDWKSKSL